MACDRNGARLAGWCAARSGISRVGSRAANVGGGFLTQLEQAQEAVMGQAMMPVVNRIAGPAARLQQRTEPVKPWVSPLLQAGGWALGRQYGREARLPQAVTALSGGGLGLLNLALKFTPHGRAIKTAVAVADGVGNVAALGVARASRTAAAGEVVQERRRLWLFKKEERIKFWRSGLTPLLNRSDVMTRQGISSRGLMLSARGRAWHLGSSTVETSHGRQTITHLQSLGVLGLQHYYFNRRLTRAEAAGIASGQVAADSVPGYAGQVSRVESLVPAWAHAKHTFIKTRLHWPNQTGGQPA